MTEFILSYFLKSAVLSAAILLIYLFLRLSRQRYSQSCRRFVWAAVIVCLCLPFELLPSIVTFQIPHTADTDSESDISAVEPAVSDSSISGIVSLPTAPPQDTSSQPNSVGTSGGKADLAADSRADSIADSDTPRDILISPDAFTLICSIIFVGWAAGAVGCLSYELIGCVVMQKKLSRGCHPVESERQTLYLRLCERFGIRRPPELYVCGYIHSPMLCGFIKPKILLPVLDISDNSAVGILGHELIHYKRHDLWLKLVGLLACSLHWFNPVVHFASRQLAQSIELACDEQLLDGLDSEARGSYGRVLLGIIRGCGDMPSTLTTHFNPRRTAVKERFINIMDNTIKKRGLAVMTAALAVCLIAGASFACETDQAYSDTTTISENQNQADTSNADSSASQSEYDQSLTELLYLTVAEIREKYGELTLEYSENGPGQPVYSISGFPGALIVFHRLDMDTPPADDRYPDEVLINNDNSDIGTDNASIDSLYGLKLGTEIDDYDLYEWYHTGFTFTTGIASVSTVVDGVRLTAKMTDSGASPPDIGNGDVYSLWLSGWGEEYRKQPLGKIIQLRLAVADRYDYPPSDGSTHTATTLAEIMAAHNRGLISDTGCQLFYDLLSGSSTSFPEYDSVKISEFTLTFTDTREDSTMIFDFTVTESGLDTLPIGNYHKLVTDGSYCWIQDFELSYEKHEWNGNQVLSDAVDQVQTFIRGTYIWNCPFYGKGVTYPGMHNYLCDYYGRYEILTLDRFKQLAADKFGCTDIDALGIENYIYGDNVKYIQAEKLWYDNCFDVVSAYRDGDEVMVTVQLWAECNALIRSHKITYTLTTDGKWLGYEIIEKSEYEPFGLRYIADEGEK